MTWELERPKIVSERIHEEQINEKTIYTYIKLTIFQIKIHKGLNGTKRSQFYLHNTLIEHMNFFENVCDIFPVMLVDSRSYL